MVAVLNEIKITIFVDGDIPPFIEGIKDWWISEWSSNYLGLGDVLFDRILDVKQKDGFSNLPDELKPAFNVRNPDVFFVAHLNGKHFNLGGIEITTHSPDGSNVEKRYPFIWSGRKYRFNSFIVCPYMKVRANGQHNRLPNRHSMRNIEFAEEWFEKRKTFHQIIPIQELQPSVNLAESFISHELINLKEISKYFSSYLAYMLGSEEAIEKIDGFVSKAKSLAVSCASVTKYTKPSSFYTDGNRIIQIYNTRPDSGHWERGEGQFDSIDGRLMFTSDGLKNNEKIEFWMPQLSKEHPWVTEQIARNYGSKRFRNINVVLKDDVTVKYLEDLSDDDVKILLANPRLTLERLDWEPGFYCFEELTKGDTIQNISRKGMKSTNLNIINEIERVLSSLNLFLSTHRVYQKKLEEEFVDGVNKMPCNSTIIAPRINKQRLMGFNLRKDVNIIYAENCTKIQLLALRQLHRHCF